MKATPKIVAINNRKKSLTLNWIDAHARRSLRLRRAWEELKKRYNQLKQYLLNQ